MTPDLAQQVIEKRSGTSGAFKNLGDIAEALGKDSFQQVSNDVTVRSSEFTIQSIGRLADKSVYTRLVAVVDRSVVPIKILYYRDISSLGPGL